MTEDISHKEIYVRLCEVEAKVDKLQVDTASVVTAFQAAQGAFTVLEWLAKAARPILWIGGVVAALGVMWDQIKVK